MGLDLAGQMLGKYRILEEIGRGGMAAVYKAWDTANNRHVALKVLPPYFQHDAEFLRRFLQEARRTVSPSVIPTSSQPTRQVRPMATTTSPWNTWAAETWPRDCGPRGA